VDPSGVSTTLGHFPVGCRLLVRSKKNWRFAVVCRKTEEFISLSVASPKGGTYRLRRAADIEINFDGAVPYLVANETDGWRENFSPYDLRW
jgi:hypothetical protein